MINLSMAEPDSILRPRLSVIGIGGAGGNAINNMIRSNLEGCDFICANTDSQALAQSLAARKIQLGVNLSRGLGAGSRPEIGQAAAEEQLPDILGILDGSDMVFITAGMGGGTGTGAAPVIARAARESGILTVGVVTKPFHFEGSQRMRQAEKGISELQEYVDTLIVIPNQNLFRIANERTTFAEAFRLADEVLNSGVRGITDLMVMPGFMNLDFADVKTVMGEMGKAMMGTGEADGDNRAIRAAEAAISNPLLDDISMKGARGVLINITGGLDMTLFEVDQAANRIREEVDPEAQIKVGSTLGEDLEGRIRVSVIATGIDAAIAEQQRQRAGSSATAPLQQSSMRATPDMARDMGRRVMPAARPVASPVQAQAPAAASVNVSTSYFSMPQAMTPQMATQQAEMENDAPAQHAPTPMMPERDPIVEKTVKPAVSMPRQVEPAATPAPAYAATPRATMPQSPLRQPVSAAPQRVQPATAAARSNEPSSDMRVTQLTSSGAQTSTTTHVSQRSQSLFQRITGFGMVRPSAARDAEEALRDVEEVCEPRLSVDPSDRPAISGEGQTDLL
ncbi:MAG: cell division protein FtsZ, partial [Alphaproteobacteria bacterium]|nr:cell division protein FtsZ [Alphaproteobacteria bacterium]